MGTIREHAEAIDRLGMSDIEDCFEHAQAIIDILDSAERVWTTTHDYCCDCGSTIIEGDRVGGDPRGGMCHANDVPGRFVPDPLN